MTPICMFNALWFRPDGGAEQYAEYGAAVQPIMVDVGAELLFPFLPVQRSLEGGLDPDVVAFVRYPSQAAFDEMWRSDAYQRIAHLRTDAVNEAILTRCVMDPSDSQSPGPLASGIAVLNCLWFNDGGRATYDAYLAAAAPLVQAVGGHFVAPRLLPEQSLGSDFTPDLMFLGHYPSLAALSALVDSEDYKRPGGAGAIRTAALDRSATTILTVP
jgi:uncharacterized protein (DUF1330 family)